MPRPRFNNPELDAAFECAERIRERAQQYLKDAQQSHHSVIFTLMQLFKNRGQLSADFLNDIGTKTCQVYSDNIRLHLLSTILAMILERPTHEQLTERLLQQLIEFGERSDKNATHLVNMLESATQHLEENDVDAPRH